MAFTLLSDLPVGSAHSAICVRIVRLWDFCGNKEDQPPLHVDMVMVDDKVQRLSVRVVYCCCLPVLFPLLHVYLCFCFGSRLHNRRLIGKSNIRRDTWGRG
jgi:hypothetical protein